MTVTEREGPPVTEPEDDLVFERVHIEPPRGRVARLEFFLPIGALLAMAVLLALVLSRGTMWSVIRFGGLYILPGGIDFAVPFAVTVLDLTPWQVLLLTMYVDAWVTLFWLWNLDHLTRFERVDRMVTKSRARADKLWARRPWLRFASGVGLALFILIPLPGTGSFTGIVAGKLIELPPWEIWTASIVGTSVRVAALAFGFEAIF